MLSDVALDILMQPIIDRQEEIDRFVLEVIANRIREVGQLTPSDIYKIKRLVQMGADIILINEELARLADLQVRDIKNMMRDVALDFYIDAKPLYDYRHKSYIPYENNPRLQRLVTAIGNVTSETYQNLSNSNVIGFLISYPNNPSKTVFKSIKNTYQIDVDRAIQAIQNKTIDYNTAIRRTINELAASGVRKVYYPSGYSQRLDSAVRRDIMDGVHQINIQMQLMIGEETGADGIELSAHMNSALDHEPIQGRQFSMKDFDKMQSVSDFQDVQGNKYPAMERAIGMWNCRHLVYPIIVGVTKPRYTNMQLQQFIDRNHAGYTTEDGKHMTMYECTQYQRKLETKIRQAKDGQILFRKSGDMEEARKYQAQINRYMEQYKQFSNAVGLRQKIDRTRVNGYRKIKV